MLSALRADTEMLSTETPAWAFDLTMRLAVVVSGMIT